MKHAPITHGLDQATNVPPDTWELFFGLCWEWYDEVQRRRAGKQPSEVTIETEAEKCA